MTNKPDLMPQQAIPPLSVQAYQRYNPSAFNDSLTILEKLNKMIYQLNQLGKLSNSLVDNWNELVKWILGNGLNEIVSEEIDKRIADGTFDNLFNGILGDLANLTTVDKTTIVNAINEVHAIALENEKNIGDMPTLITENKNTLVEAINEIKHQTELNTQGPIMVAESTGHGVISGFKVTQQKVLAMAVDIGDGNIPNIVHMENGDRFVLDSVSLAVDPSDALLNRKDIVYVNKDGVISYLAGAPSMNPQPPVLPIGGEPLAIITVEATDTTVNNNDITDKRNLKALNFLKTSSKDNLVNAINELLTMIINNENSNNDKIGDINNLPTNDKTNIVNSIIEIFAKIVELDNEFTRELQNIVDKIGDLNSLNTSDKSTVVNSINSLKAYFDTNMGDLSRLPTQDKVSLVNSIIEIYNKIEQDNVNVDGRIGDLNKLPTTDKTNIVNSIIELVNDYNDKIGDLSLLPTTVKTNIVLAITELFNDKVNKTSFDNTIGDMSQLNTSDKSNIVNAINAVVKDAVEKIGDLNLLKTTDKSNLVNSINEIYDNLDSEITNKLNSLIINVKDFGAVGDGVTDDAPAIQRAIDSTPNGIFTGGTIYFPAGDYLLGSTIRLKKGIILKGFSPARSRLLAGQTDKYMVVADTAFSIAIQDLMFDGGGLQGARAVYIVHGSGVRVENVWVDSCHTAFTTEDTYFVEFTSVKIWGTKTGYYMATASNVINMNNCYSLTNEKAIEWYRSSTLSMTGCSFEGNALVQMYLVEGANISGCYWEGMHELPDPVAFIQLGNPLGQTASGIRVTGCSFIVKAQYGVVLHAVTGVTVDNCYFGTSVGGVAYYQYDNTPKIDVKIGQNNYNIQNKGYDASKAIGFIGEDFDSLNCNLNDYQLQPTMYYKQKEPQSSTITNECGVIYWTGSEYKVKFKDASGSIFSKTIAFKEDIPPSTPQ